MILLSYEGSPDAQAAIEHAARLMPGADATVLTIWEPFTDVMARSSAAGMGLGWWGTEDEMVSAASEQSALAIATEGASRATDAGLVASPRVARAGGGLAQVILAVAAEVDADVVVLGTRGLGGVKSLLLGSVSHEVVQHADRAVLVVPSGDVAGKRRGWTAHAEAVAGAA